MSNATASKIATTRQTTVEEKRKTKQLTLGPTHSWRRSGGRGAAAAERVEAPPRCACKGTEGSNPSLSARCVVTARGHGVTRCWLLIRILSLNRSLILRSDPEIRNRNQNQSPARLLGGKFAS